MDNTTNEAYLKAVTLREYGPDSERKISPRPVSELAGNVQVLFPIFFDCE